MHTLVHAMDTFPFSLQGVPAEELSAVLSHVPQAEKFAKFWICQAKLLARSGPFDVLQLYREAVSAGAEVSGACQLPVFPASTLEGFLEIQGPGFGMSLEALVTGEKVI